MDPQCTHHASYQHRVRHCSPLVRSAHSDLLTCSMPSLNTTSSSCSLCAIITSWHCKQAAGRASLQHECVCCLFLCTCTGLLCHGDCVGPGINILAGRGEPRCRSDTVAQLLQLKLRPCTGLMCCTYLACQCTCMLSVVFAEMAAGVVDYIVNPANHYITVGESGTWP
jgi:hypothetical protein